MVVNLGFVDSSDYGKKGGTKEDSQCVASKLWVDWEWSRFRKDKITGSTLDRFGGPIRGPGWDVRWWSSFRLEEHRTYLRAMIF